MNRIIQRIRDTTVREFNIIVYIAFAVVVVAWIVTHIL